MKKFLLLALVFSLAALQSSEGQIRYVQASDFTLVGHAVNRPSVNPYHRIDTARFSLPSGVEKQYLCPAGLAVAFRTNSPQITARWSTTPRSLYANMTPIAQRGLDLYIRRDGEWVWAGVGTPSENTHEAVVVQKMDSSWKECLLYLPLFAELTSLEIGIDEGFSAVPMDDPFRHRVVIYGSSIAHGASGSRSGMAYPARLSRSSGIHFINLGCSGNGKMQREMWDVLVESKPDMLILDCMPNPSAKEIAERTVPFVHYLRDRLPGVPIVLIQTTGRETVNFNHYFANMEAEKRAAAREAARILKEEKVPDFYFIDGEDFLGLDHLGTCDGTHPNDLGFDRMINKIAPKIFKILSRYGIR